MRIMSIEKVEPGMKVGRSIYSANGKTLLANGVKLTSRYIERIKELGIVVIYIYDESVGAIQIDDVVSEKTRLEAIKVTKEAMENIKLNPTLHLASINEAVNDIINELLNHCDTMVNLVDIRALNDYIFGHSVNVAVLSLITAITMGFNKDKLRILGAGALFHDVGKTAIPENILVRATPLTDDEEKLLEEHTTIGFHILRKIESLSLQVAHIALQHHEHYDGTGYPRKIKGDEINEFARIITVADIYDRLTSGMAGGLRFSPLQAVELIIANSGKFFAPEVVKRFIHIIALFPIGTLVVLNTQEKGVVVETFRDFPTRPRVRLLVNSQGNKINPPYEMELASNLDFYIVRVIEEGEL
ncbi:MAG TPA: HD-GYP domain-containing protein [Desulfosporosinus sp.]|nr:HD-GYP domain-containing protein [Desulfosporosinus sp.]